MKKFSLIRFIAFLMLVSSLYSQEDPSSNEGLAIFIDLIESSDGSGIAIVAPRNTYQLIRSEAPSGLYIGTYEKKFYQDSGFTFLITRNNFWYYKSRNVAEFLEQEGLEHRVFFHNPIYTQQEGSNIQCEGDIFVPNKGIGRFYLLQFIPNQISYQAVYLIYCCFEPENYDTAKEEFEKVSRLIYRASRGQILYP